MIRKAEICQWVGTRRYEQEEEKWSRARRSV